MSTSWHSGQCVLCSRRWDSDRVASRYSEGALCLHTPHESICFVKVNKKKCFYFFPLFSDGLPICPPPYISWCIYCVEMSSYIVIYFSHISHPWFFCTFCTASHFESTASDYRSVCVWTENETAFLIHFYPLPRIIETDRMYRCILV